MKQTDTPRSLKNTLKAAFPATLPVLTGFGVLGIAYGILMQSKGYGPLWAMLFSALAFCGSMQFVAITFLTGIFEPVQALVMSLMVNARHLFYGLSMLDKYKGCGKAKQLLIYCLCDETFAINSTAQVPEGLKKKDFYLAVSLLNWSYWVIASFLGGVLGNLITFNTTGLDFALTALFVVLFIEQIQSKQQALCGLTGAAAAGCALLVFGADRMVIPAMGLIILMLLVRRDRLCD